MSNIFVTLSRSSYQGYQTLSLWDTTHVPSGTLVKRVKVPTREVRKFCLRNKLGFDTTYHGFWGTSIYANDRAGQMFFKLKFDVQVPMKDERDAMVEARKQHLEKRRRETLEQRGAPSIPQAEILGNP